MQKKKISISKNQRFSDVIPEIPDNTIVCKTVPGCGATYSELKTKRNSIIIEPNRPVIIGKTNDLKHAGDNLIGVYEGITTQDVVDYLSASKGKSIKIMTTPESFKKVVIACEIVGINIKNECFLLFDECHKTVQDIDYREDITLPFDYFFKCKHKALVTATLPRYKFLDSRFDDFSTLKIIPDYDYRHHMKLDITNNVLLRVKEVIKLATDDTPIFFFVNSTDTIHALMKQTGTIDDSAVFCSDKSVNKLHVRGFKSVYQDWQVSKMKKFNWMTSRFFNAVDIELPVKPIVVMVTDCFIAEFTMFDPYIDAPQVVGRFRNGVSNIIHITNINNEIPQRSMEQIVQKVKCYKDTYSTLATFRDTATDEIQKEAYQDALNVLPYNQFLNTKTHKEDSFRINNYIDGEVVKCYYREGEALKKAYADSNYFYIDRDYNLYPFGEQEMLQLENAEKSVKEKRMQVVNMLEMLEDYESTSIARQLREDLINADALIVEAYDTIGKEEIEKLNYSPSKLRKAIVIKKHTDKTSSTDAIKLVNNTFFIGRTYHNDYIVEELESIYKTLNIPAIGKIKPNLILEFFDAQPTRDHKGRGYKLLRAKFHTP